METFKIFVTVIGKVIWKLFAIGIFAYSMIATAKELEDYFDSDEV